MQTLHSLKEYRLQNLSCAVIEPWPSSIAVLPQHRNDMLVTLHDLSIMDHPFTSKEAFHLTSHPPYGHRRRIHFSTSILFSSHHSSLPNHPSFKAINDIPLLHHDSSLRTIPTISHAPTSTSFHSLPVLTPSAPNLAPTILKLNSLCIS